MTGVGMGAFVDLRAFGQRGKEEVGHDLEWGVPKGWSLPMRELGVVENWGGGGGHCVCFEKCMIRLTM